MKTEGAMETGKRGKTKETTILIINNNNDSNNSQYVKYLLHTRQSSEHFYELTHVILTVAL